MSRLIRKSIINSQTRAMPSCTVLVYSITDGKKNSSSPCRHVSLIQVRLAPSVRPPPREILLPPARRAPPRPRRFGQMAAPPRTRDSRTPGV